MEEFKPKVNVQRHSLGHMVVFSAGPGESQRHRLFSRSKHPDPKAAAQDFAAALEGAASKEDFAKALRDYSTTKRIGLYAGSWRAELPGGLTSSYSVQRYGAEAAEALARQSLVAGRRVEPEKGPDGNWIVPKLK